MQSYVNINEEIQVWMPSMEIWDKNICSEWEFGPREIWKNKRKNKGLE